MRRSRVSSCVSMKHKPDFFRRHEHVFEEGFCPRLSRAIISEEEIKIYFGRESGESVAPRAAMLDGVKSGGPAQL